MALPSTISIPLPRHLTPGLIARLARDVVMELKALPDILEPYCITTQQYNRIKELPFFKRVYEDFAMEWNRVSSTPERVRLISAVLLEEGLPRLGSQMVDKEVSPAVAVETGKFFAKMAGVGETGKAEIGASERFVINISLGPDAKLQFTKDVTPQAGVSPEVHQLSEGEVQTRIVDAQPPWTSDGKETQQDPKGAPQQATVRPLP